VNSSICSILGLVKQHTLVVEAVPYSNCNKVFNFRKFSKELDLISFIIFISWAKFIQRAKTFKLSKYTKKGFNFFYKNM